MNIIFVGEYIYKRRKELGLTQEQLCDGICDPATISRIENGRQAPNLPRMNAILQRLGLPDERYYAVLSKNEMEIEALKKEIVACNVTNRIEEGFTKIEQLERIADPSDNLTKQFALRSKAWLGGLNKQYSYQEQIELLMQALRLTVPQFEIDKIGNFLYAFDEVKILNQLAIAYSRNGEKAIALSIYRQLIDYIFQHYQGLLNKNGIFPMVLLNYARELDLAGYYKESLQIAEKGKSLCVQYGHHQNLPSFLAIMGECYHFLDQDKESAKLYRQAYYLYQVVEDTTNLKIVQKEAKSYLNLDFCD